MTSVCKAILKCLYKKRPNNFRFLSNNVSDRKFTSRHSYPLVYVISGTLILYATYKYRQNMFVHTIQAKNKKHMKSVMLRSRERRFIKFASVEYDGELYMTPEDFLESIIDTEPRPRLKRRQLTPQDIESIRVSTPTLNQGSPQLFRSLSDKGIISYSEYLFLLSILTKPQSGFRIAFNMFDTDGNARVDKKEFLVIEAIMGGIYKADPLLMEERFSHAWKGKRDMVVDAEGVQRRHAVNTTLIVHFFGPKGRHDLNFDGFQKFILHLQTEVLELEFYEFSKGLPMISEVDFAKILLRYTYLDAHEFDNNMHLDRLLNRIKDTKGITFDEFYEFCQFLNNLEDFSIAMRMYTLADHPVSKDEFHRAVKICTGTSLSEHLVDTVFAIFDENGDGLLSHQEFIAIMKDRLHRGLKSHAKKEGWKAFKMCVRREMKRTL